MERTYSAMFVYVNMYFRRYYGRMSFHTEQFCCIHIYIFLVDWCGDPPEVPGASVIITGHKAGSVATYSCHQGFVAVGGQQVNDIIL